jgi:hypothetical protein
MDEPKFEKYIAYINYLLKTDKFCISKPIQLKNIYLKLHPDKTTKYNKKNQTMATDLFKKLQQKEASYYKKNPCDINLDNLDTISYSISSNSSKTKTPLSSFSFNLYDTPSTYASSNSYNTSYWSDYFAKSPKSRDNKYTYNFPTSSPNSFLFPTKTQNPQQECPPGKIRNPKTGRCINNKTKKTQQECPPGKIRNPKTGRCINNKTKKTQQKCPPGKIRNPKTGRCINNKTKKTQQECPPGKIRNPKTGRCINK